MHDLHLLSPSMRFTEAAAAFLEARKPLDAAGRSRFIAPRTYRDYEQYFKTLGTFFGELRLDEIRYYHFAQYQQSRARGVGFTRVIGNVKGREPVASPAGPDRINAELGRMKKLMKLAGAWTPELEANYMPLQPADNDIPRALSPDEQDRFLQVAASNPAWEVVWWYSLVALHLTFSSDELRTIRLGDINLTHQLISVNRRYGKNATRRRTVALCDAACLWALEQLVQRAVERGSNQPQHYLFPLALHSCSHGATYDNERPMSETGLRKPFEAVREAAGVPWFRLNGWRHTAITRLAEQGVPIAVIMKRSGHLTAKMSEHYTHISEQVERSRMEAAALASGSSTRAGALQPWLVKRAPQPATAEPFRYQQQATG